MTGGNAGLPTGAASLISPFRPSANDGSGRAIQMESPFRRMWRTASGYTKGSWYGTIISVLIFFLGVRTLWRTNASIWLTCHAQGCELQITPPQGSTLKMKLARKQLVKSEAIKVSAEGDFVRLDTSPQVTRTKGKKAKYQNSGPDVDGNYNSYHVVFREPSDEYRDYGDEEHPEVSLAPIYEYTYPESASGNRVLQMRKFNLGQTKRRTRTMVSKVDSYVRQRRHKLTIKENCALSWQGVLATVLGLFAFLLTILIGQFSEPEDPWKRKPSKRGVRQPPKPPSRTTKSRVGPSYKGSGNRYSSVPKQSTSRKSN